MTLPSSGDISWADICGEFGLDPFAAVWARDFYGLGGVASSGALKFRDFLGKQASLISTTSLVDTRTTTSRAITLPSFAKNDTCIVIIETRGSSNTLATTSTGWRVVANVNSAGATTPTTMSVLACENATVANRALTVTGFPTTGHTQVAYVVQKGGVLDDAKDSTSNTTTNDPPATSALTASTSWLVIAACSSVMSTNPTGMAGFTFDTSTYARDTGNYCVMTAWEQIAGSGATVNPGAFGGTKTSTRAAIGTFPINMSLGAGYAATYTPAAGNVSADNLADTSQSASKTFTANKAVTWTYTVTSGAATGNRTSGTSNANITFSLAPTTVNQTSTVDVTATDGTGNVTNWTLTLTANKLPAATYTPTASSQSDNNSTDTSQPASVTITASRSVTWTWTRTGSTAGSASIATGGSGKTITFSLTSTTSSRTSTFNVTADDGYTQKTYTVTLTAAAQVTAATYTPVAGTYTANDSGLGEAGDSATFTITASKSVTWTYTLTYLAGSAGASATPASGGTGTTWTGTLLTGVNARSAKYVVTADDGVAAKTWTVTLNTTATGISTVSVKTITTAQIN